MHFETSVAAALAGIPSHAIRVLAVRESETDAYVLFDARPGGPSYEYGVHCFRKANGWHEGSSGNGCGWTSTDLERELGTISDWDRAPAGATRVRFTYLGQSSEVPVENGYYLATWWRMPCPEHEWPRLDAFLVSGNWQLVARPELEEAPTRRRARPDGGW